MELLFILPILVGYAVYEIFWGDNDDNASDDAPPNNPKNNPDSAPDSDDDLRAGTSASETLRGGQGDDFILGAAGADTIEGGKADDILLGEDGADWLYGGLGFDTLAGGAGNDTLAGLKGLDFLVGGSGNDALDGGAGNDVLVGSSGADTLEGGAGIDLLSGIDVRAPLDPLAVNFVDSVAGADTAFAALETYVTATYGAAANGAILDRLEAGFSEPGTNPANDFLYGGRGNDTIIGDFSDTIIGGAGADVMEIISGGAGQAVVVNDFTPASDKINIFVAAGTNPAVSLVNGATPDAGVSVVVAGDVVAVLKGLQAAAVPLSSISVTVAA